jgi:hypothetical protein
VPIAEIARERTGQQSIDRACAATQGLLCCPDQDKGQTLLDRLEVGPQIDGTAGDLSYDRDLRPAVKKKASRIDDSIRTDSETDLASELARDIGLHALSSIGTKPNSGDNGETACPVLGSGVRLGAAPAESSDQPREEPSRTNAGHSLPTRGRVRQSPRQSVELLWLQSILLFGLVALSTLRTARAQRGSDD